MLISRRWFAGAGALLVLPLALALPATAYAAAAVGDDCSIVDAAPNSVAIGIKPQRVQFDVATDCDDDVHDMQWMVTGSGLPYANHNTWFAACTYIYGGPNIVDCSDQGATVLNLIGTGVDQGNQMAGVQPLYAYAFDDVNGDGVDDGDSGAHIYYDSTFSLLKRTTWGTSFKASATTRRYGQKVTLSGQIQRANWDLGAYEKYGVYVTLQFRRRGAENFRNLQTVWDNGASATTTVRVTRSGTYRYSYSGSGTEAASTSKGASVTVRG